MSVDITQSYPIATCSPGQPLLAEVGGTGVSNVVGSTLTYTGAVVLTPGISGAVTLTAAAVSGVSAPVITGPTLVSATGNAVGNVVNVKTKVTFTATAATAVFTVGIPAALTALFPDALQADGVANVLTGTGLGNLTALASVAASRNISFTFALGGTSGTYTVNLDFGFFVN